MSTRERLTVQVVDATGVVELHGRDHRTLGRWQKPEERVRRGSHVQIAVEGRALPLGLSQAGPVFVQARVSQLKDSRRVSSAGFRPGLRVQLSVTSVRPAAFDDDEHTLGGVRMPLDSTEGGSARGSRAEPSSAEPSSADRLASDVSDVSDVSDEDAGSEAIADTVDPQGADITQLEDDVPPTWNMQIQAQPAPELLPPPDLLADGIASAGGVVPAESLAAPSAPAASSAASVLPGPSGPPGPPAPRTRGATLPAQRPAPLADVPLADVGPGWDARFSPRDTAEPEGLFGCLHDLSLIELTQIFELSRKTALLLLRPREGAPGEVYIDEGRVTFARVGDTQGPEAFFLLTHARTGAFRVRFGWRAPAPNIEQPTAFLLLEAHRRIDEAARSDADLPLIELEDDPPSPPRVSATEAEESTRATRRAPGSLFSHFFTEATDD